MKIEYDKAVDALYIRLQEKHVSRTVEIVEGWNAGVVEWWENHECQMTELKCQLESV